MSLIEALYLPARQHADDVELERWVQANTPPPEAEDARPGLHLDLGAEGPPEGEGVGQQGTAPAAPGTSPEGVPTGAPSPPPDWPHPPPTTWQPWGEGTGTGGEPQDLQPSQAGPVLPSGAPPEGFLGVQRTPEGRAATVLNQTVTDARLNAGRPTNIPLLVPGQVDVPRLLAGQRPTPEQYERSIAHALARTQQGEALPSYDTIEDAVQAAEHESQARGQIHAAPAPSTPLSVFQAIDRDVAEGLKDAPRQILGGLRDAAVEVFRKLEALQEWSTRRSEAELGNVQTRPTHRLSELLPPVGAPATTTGHLVRGTSQFLGAFLPIAAATGGTGLLTGVAGGTVAQLLAFDPAQPRMSNLIREYLPPALQNVLTTYLAYAPGESTAESYLKTSLEALGLAAGGEGLIKAFQLLKAAHHAAFAAQGGLLRSEAGSIRLPGAGAEPPPRPQVTEAPVAELRLDPERFQYKVQTGEGGTSGSLAGVERYDPHLAGVIQVWVDPADGQTYVVNGHNRVALAQRTGQASMPVMYLQAASAEEARTIGAVTNIAEGRGNAIDAAKLFRDTGMSREDLRAMGVPLREKIATDGLALANLQESLFEDVIQGRLPLERGVIIGSRVADPDQQLKLVQLLREQGRVNVDTVRELADFVREAPSEQVLQETLFGAEEVTQSLALDKARLAGAIREQLSKDKTLFARVSKESAAQRLTEAGNVINIAESERISQESAQLLDIFDKLKYRSGPVSDILNQAAEEIRAGGNFTDVRQRTYQRLTEALPEAVRGAEAEGVGAGGPILPGEPTTSTGDVLAAGDVRTRGAVSEAGVPIRERPPEPSLLSEATGGTPPGPPPPPPPGPAPTPAPEPRPPSVFERAFESPGRFNPRRQEPSARLRRLTAEINVRARELGLMAEQTRGAVTHEATLEAARRLIASGDMSLERLLALQPGDILNAEEGTAARLLRDTAVKRHRQVMHAAERGDPEAQADVVASTYLASRVEANVEAASGTEPARALSARRILSRPDRRTTVSETLDILRRLREGPLTEEAEGSVRQAVGDIAEGVRRRAAEAREGSPERTALEGLGADLAPAEAQAETAPGEALAGVWDVILRHAIAAEETPQSPELWQMILTEVQRRINEAVPYGRLMGGLWEQILTANVAPQLAQIERQIDPNLLLSFWRNLADETERRAFTTYFAETSRAGRLADAFLEARAAGLLGPRSIVRNLVGNLATTAWAVPERLAGAAMSAALPGTGDEVYFHEALDLLHGYAAGLKEAVVNAGLTLKTGESHVFPELNPVEGGPLPAISGQALGVSGPAGRMIDVLGEVIRAPFRAMLAGDDVFKWLDYKGQQYALAYRDYRQRLAAGATQAQAQAAYEHNLARPPAWLHEQARAFSLYTTFNDEILNPAGQKLMELRDVDGPSGWIARYLIPFARTPMNVMGYGSERTPGLNLLSSHFWQEIKAGGARRDQALGSLALGSALWTVVVGLAVDGKLTGRGPRDPALRAQYRDQGWQPYSFVLPDGQHLPFRNFEPLSQILAQAADYNELMSRGASYWDLLELSTAMVLSSTEYMGEQPMVQGIAEVVNALRSDDPHAGHVLQKQIASTFPLPGIQTLSRMAVELTDPTQRETYGPHGGSTPLGKEVARLWDEIAARIPGLSNDLYPKRDRLFGYPLLRQGGGWVLSPSAPSAQAPNAVRGELDAQGIAIGQIPKTLGSGRVARSPLDPQGPEAEPIELTAQEWDRWQELAGTVRLNPDPRRPLSSRKLTLEEYLAAYMETKEYADLSDGPEGGKAVEIRRVVNEYRQAAKEQMIGESERLPGLIAAKQKIREYQRMDKPQQAREAPRLERQLGLSLGR